VPDASTEGKTSPTSKPLASLMLLPVRPSALLFIITALPMVSVTMTPSPMLESVTESLSISSASWFSAFLRFCSSRFSSELASFSSLVRLSTSVSREALDTSSLSCTLLRRSLR